MSRAQLLVVRRVSPLEGVAWYWLWSGTLCLWLVPAARSASPWLVGAPLILLVAHFVTSWLRKWSSSALHMSVLRPVALMAPADVAAFARRLRSSVAANSPMDASSSRIPGQRQAATGFPADEHRHKKV